MNKAETWKKAIIGLAAVPFVLIEYWVQTLTSIHDTHTEKDETPKETKRHCGAFAFSFGLLLFLISYLDTSGSLLPSAMLMTFIAVASLLLNRKLAKMMGIDKNETFTSLLFFFVLPALSCMFLYFEGWRGAVVLFALVIAAAKLMKLLQIMSLDFCENYIVPLLKMIVTPFQKTIYWRFSSYDNANSKQWFIAEDFPIPSFLRCKLVVQKLE